MVSGGRDEDGPQPVLEITSITREHGLMAIIDSGSFGVALASPGRAITDGVTGGHTALSGPPEPGSVTYSSFRGFPVPVTAEALRPLLPAEAH